MVPDKLQKVEKLSFDAKVVEKFLNGLYHSFLGPTVVRMHQKLFKN